MKEINRIKKIIVRILKKNGALRAGIFGSYARGDPKKNSDIDILVKLPKDLSLLDFVGIKLELEDALKIAQYYQARNIGGPSLVDCYLAALLRKKSSDLFLLPKNHKDFPLGLFSRHHAWILAVPRAGKTHRAKKRLYRSRKL